MLGEVYKMNNQIKKAISLLKGCHVEVYIGTDMLPMNLDQDLRLKAYGCDTSGIEPTGGFVAKRGNRIIFFVQNYMLEHLFWHEVWHVLQFKFSREKYSLDRNWNCPTLTSQMLEVGYDQLAAQGKDSSWVYKEDSFSIEIPAHAVWDQPDLVLGYLEEEVTNLKNWCHLDLYGFKTHKGRYPILSCPVSGKVVHGECVELSGGRIILNMIEYEEEQEFKHFLLHN